MVQQQGLVGVWCGVGGLAKPLGLTLGLKPVSLVPLLTGCVQQQQQLGLPG
jgi:hypothetical protein